METDYFRQLFHGSIDAIARIDKESKIIEVNDHFLKLFCFEDYELKGQRLDDMIVDIDDKFDAIQLNERVSAGEFFTTEGLRTTRFGKQYNVFITGIPILNNGKYMGAFIRRKDGGRGHKIQ